MRKICPFSKPHNSPLEGCNTCKSVLKYALNLFLSNGTSYILKIVGAHPQIAILKLAVSLSPPCIQFLIFPPYGVTLHFFRKLKQTFDAEFQALQNHCFISIFFSPM